MWSPCSVCEHEDVVKPKISFDGGERVNVAEDLFQSQNGIVEKIDQESGKLSVSVSIFGRETLVDLEYWLVERMV